MQAGRILVNMTTEHSTSSATKVMAGRHIATAAKKAVKSLKHTASKLSTQSAEAVKKKICPHSTATSDAASEVLSSSSSNAPPAPSRSSLPTSCSSFHATVKDVSKEEEDDIMVIDAPEADAEEELS